MKNLLFLVHRIPYPPNKGDKIRAFHFLKALSFKYNVYLGAFVDDSNDWQYVEDLELYCEETCLLGLDPSAGKIKSLLGFLTNKALSLPYYKQNKFQQWVNKTIQKQNINKVLIFSSVMAQYVSRGHNVELIADFVDVDSNKWLQYSMKRKWPLSWVYKREAEKLFQFERTIASKAKATIFVSEKEADFFKSLVPETTSNICYVNNGVDTDFFSPEHEGKSPYITEDDVIVFTGAMDYWANIDAVKWFAEQVFPKILLQHKNSKFYIVGSNPDKEVLSLAAKEGVFTTGRVDDIRPYIAHAKLVVAPVRIARGIQNKVLEAMAMEKQVFCTSAAIEGISVSVEQNVSISDTADEFAENICNYLDRKPNTQRSINNRRFVKEKFSWELNTEQLAELIG